MKMVYPKSYICIISKFAAVTSNLTHEYRELVGQYWKSNCISKYINDAKNEQSNPIQLVCGPLSGHRLQTGA